MRTGPATGLGRFRRKLQIALGLIWLAVGGLQYQPFMFKKSFVASLEGTTVGRAQWIKSSVHWALSDVAVHYLTLYNASWATIQVVIGLLILYRRRSRSAWPRRSLGRCWSGGSVRGSVGSGERPRR